MQPAFTAPLHPLRAKPTTYVGLRPSTCVPPRAPRIVAPRTHPTAKLFDWKKRADPNHAVIPAEDDGLFTLHNLKPAPGSRQKRKRKGRGRASGKGGTCGFGMRGQKSRSGRSVRPGFEGGQTPLYRRIPKYVGRPMGPGHKKTEYALLKLEHLNTCEEGEEVNYETLKERGVVTKQKRKIFKVVGGGELNVRGLTVRAHAFTSSAVAAIESGGGRCVLISPTTGKDIIIEDDEEESDDDAVGEESEAEEEEVEDRPE